MLQVIAFAFLVVVASAALSTPLLLVLLGLREMGWRWQHGALFSAMLASTDALAVTAVLRRAGGPGSLVVLMEGESLLNDASGERGGGAGGRRGAAPALQWHASEQLALR